MKMSVGHEVSDPMITCPNCSTSIPLTESLAAPLVKATRARYERKLADQEAKIAEREAAIHAQQADLAEARATLEEQVAARLKVERDRIVAEEAAKARLIAARTYAKLPPHAARCDPPQASRGTPYPAAKIRDRAAGHEIGRIGCPCYSKGLLAPSPFRAGTGSSARCLPARPPGAWPHKPLTRKGTAEDRRGGY
jgi:hypothetical protein